MGSPAPQSYPQLQKQNLYIWKKKIKMTIHFLTYVGTSCFFVFFFPFPQSPTPCFFVVLSQISQCLKDLKLTNPISFQDKDYQNNFYFLFNCAINGNIISLSPCHFKHLLEISSECLPSFHAFLLLPSFLNI